MKKVISMIMALALVLVLFAVPVMAGEETGDGVVVGYLSFLNLSEDEIESRREGEVPAYRYLIEQGAVDFDGQKTPLNGILFYDSLDAMLMGLMSGEVGAIDVPDCTAKFLCATNDEVKQITLFYPDKVERFSQDLLNVLCNGYSFMMLEENSNLRNQFDQAIAEMREDGTLDELIKTHITDVAESGEPVAVAFEEFEGEPIKVAVTGSLPPIDYVAADGSFAGFNTAILAEIGKRLEKNIVLVQVDSVGRALALSQGNVDVVFWTRGASEGKDRYGILSMSEEELEEFRQEKEKNQTEEENAIMKALHESLPKDVFSNRDMPEGTVITTPFYTDLNVLVTLK